MSGAAKFTQLAQRAASLMPYLFFFVGAKAIAYVGMLALGRYIDPVAYGAIEFALSVGVLAAVLLLAGLCGASMRMALKEGEPHVLDLLAWHAAVVCAVALIVATLALLSGSSLIAMAALVAALYVAQFSSATYLRIREARIAIAFSDTFTIISVVAVVAVTALFLRRPNTDTISIGIFVVALIVMIASGIVAINHPAANFRRRAQTAFTLGLPMMMADLVGQALTQAGRLALGLVGTLEDVGMYGAIARVATGLMLIYQLCWGAFYTKLYQVEHDNADKIYAFFAAVFALSAFALMAALTMEQHMVFPQYAQRGAELSAAIPLVCAQVFQWICYAMLTTRIQRIGVSLASSVALAMILLLAGGALAFSSDYNSSQFINILIIHTIAFYLANVALIALLFSRGEKLKRTFVMVTFGLLVSTPAFLPN